MATIEIVNVSDDLDPRIKNGVETVTFQIDGKVYEIELGEANRKHLENHMNKIRETYVSKAREVTPTPAKPAAKSTGKKSNFDKIRVWARQNGYTVGDRGRIKAEIVDAFNAAQGKPDAVTEPEVVETQSDVVVTEREPLTDAKISEYMREIEDETGEPASLEALREKAHSQN